MLLQINHDIDLNTLPLVAFYKGCLEKDSRARGIDKPLLLTWLRGQVRTWQQPPGGGSWGYIAPPTATFRATRADAQPTQSMILSTHRHNTL